MKIDGNAIRPGNIIEHQGRLWRAIKTQHVKPGKGGAFLQVELKDIRDGTYEQISLSGDLIGEDAVRFLQDGMMVTVESFEDSPISVTLPEHVVLEIVEADAVVKGQTASSSYKPALLENGVRTLVPPHIEAGIRVVINTADGSYVERAKD